MRRLPDYSLAILLHLFNGNPIDVNLSADENLAEDFNYYFDTLEIKLQEDRLDKDSKPSKIFYRSHSIGNYHVSVIGKSRDILQECLANYSQNLVNNELEAEENVLLWNKEYQQFLQKVIDSGLNNRDYHLQSEDVHSVINGIITGLITLQSTSLIVDEGVTCFYNRDLSGNIESVNLDKFHNSITFEGVVDLSRAITQFEPVFQAQNNHIPNIQVNNFNVKIKAESRSSINQSMTQQVLNLNTQIQSKPKPKPQINPEQQTELKRRTKYSPLQMKIYLFVKGYFDNEIMVIQRVELERKNYCKKSAINKAITIFNKQYQEINNTEEKALVFSRTFDNYQISANFR